jgi:hypothetical protein
MPRPSPRLKAAAPAGSTGRSSPPITLMRKPPSLRFTPREHTAKCWLISATRLRPRPRLVRPLAGPDTTCERFLASRQFAAANKGAESHQCPLSPAKLPARADGIGLHIPGRRRRRSARKSPCWHWGDKRGLCRAAGVFGRLLAYRQEGGVLRTLSYLHRRFDEIVRPGNAELRHEGRVRADLPNGMQSRADIAAQRIARAEMNSR